MTFYIHGKNKITQTSARSRKLSNQTYCKLTIRYVVYIFLFIFIKATIFFSYNICTNMDIHIFIFFNDQLLYNKKKLSQIKSFLYFVHNMQPLYVLYFIAFISHFIQSDLVILWFKRNLFYTTYCFYHSLNNISFIKYYTISNLLSYLGIVYIVYTFI